MAAAVLADVEEFVGQPFIPWTRALVQYIRGAKGRREFHERILIRLLGDAGWYHIVTPDGDIYREELRSPPLVSIHRLTEQADGHRVLPAGIKDSEVYWMKHGSGELAPLTPALRTMLVRESNLLYRDDMRELGLGVPERRHSRKGPAVRTPPPPLPPPALGSSVRPSAPPADENSVWLSLVDVGFLKVGDIVPGHLGQGLFAVGSRRAHASEGRLPRRCGDATGG